jgi:hypothetical protein
MTFEFMGEEGDLAQAPPLQWQPPAAVMSDGAALAQANDQTNSNGDSQQHIGGTNNQITDVADRASFVRQVGDSPYEQLSVKSENPNVTIVWLMEPPKQADDSPRP